MGGLLHLVQREGPGRAGAPPSPLLAVPNVTAHPSTASVPTSYYLMWHYDCLWDLKGFNCVGLVLGLVFRDQDIFNSAFAACQLLLCV